MARDAATAPELKGFTFVKTLGSGGFSDVFLYDQHLPRRRVAVKVLLTEGLTAANREAFVAEANVMAQLSAHPYIVSIYTADVSDDGRPFFIMEYCSGPSLADRYKRQPLSVVETLRTGVRLSSAIATAHQAGILHRDIKPANVLTNDFGWPALTDFGISSAVENDELPLHTVTREGLGSGATTGSQSVGMSIPWSPPEMFDDQPRPDVRSDVFSLAGTLYTLLSGRTPFELPGGPNGTLDLMGRIERGQITPLSRTDVPASLLAVLQKGMAVDRHDRFTSAVDFARALQRIEIELNYAPTAIDVPNLIVPEEPIDRTSDDDATRARNVTTIKAQPAAVVIEHTPKNALVVDETVRRAAAPADATVVRRGPDTVSGVSHPEESTRRQPRSRGLLIGGVVAAAIVVGGVAFAASQFAPQAEREVASADPPAAGEPPSVDDVIGPSAQVPALVTVEEDAEGNTVFTWEATDDVTEMFRWEQTSGGDAVGAPGAETSAVLPPSTSGAPVCIEVWSIAAGAQSVESLEACDS